MFPLINMIVTKIVKFDTIPQLMKKNYGLKQRKKTKIFFDLHTNAVAVLFTKFDQ